MKNIFTLFIAFSLISIVTKANCPVNSVPNNITATSVCDKGYSIFSASVNDPNHHLVWLDTANRIIGSGNNFQQYINNSGLTFKAAAVAYDQLSTKVGPLPSQFTSTYPSQNFTNGQYFTCFSALRIDSILLRSNNPVQGFIQIWSNAPENGGYILQKYPFNITINGPTNTRVPLGAILNTGNYFINIEISGGSGILYRALSGANYPYQVSNLLSITGNNFSNSNNRYYYVFDWNVSKMCIGPFSSTFSPAIVSTKMEQLPYLETFNTGLPCDWSNTAANTNGVFQVGNSASFNSPNFSIPTDSGILFSSDINCNCDKSSSKIYSPWFNLRTYSKNSSINLNINYIYKAAQNSKVYIYMSTGEQTSVLVDSLSQQLNSFLPKSISLQNFILNDSVRFYIEHKDNGGDSSALAISSIEITNDCISNFYADLKLITDSYASEISWEIYDYATKERIAISATYTDVVPYIVNNATDRRTICLTQGNKYVFKITDRFGDGLNDGNNIGSYLLKNSCGDTIISGAGLLPFGGVNLPEPSYDSIIFTADAYKPNLGRDVTITQNDTVELDAGKYGPYLWSTGDTTRTIKIIGKNVSSQLNTFWVKIRSQVCERSDTVIVEVLPIYNPTIVISLVTDTKGSDIIWELRDFSTDSLIIKKGPFNDVIPYDVTLATHIDSVVVEFNQQLKFIITDLSGNGLYDGQNRGSIKISNECVPIIYFSNSFTTTETTIFSSNTKPVFNLGPDRSICENETVILDAGSSANEYYWNINGNTFFGSNPLLIQSSSLQLGLNAIMVQNTGSICIDADTIIITKNANPISSFQTTQQGGFITCTADENSASTYAWNFGDGSTASGKNVTHQYNNNGIFNVSLDVVNAADCSSSSNKSLTITGVGITSTEEANITLFPNPSSGIIYVDAANISNAMLDVIDLQGRSLYRLNNFDASKTNAIDLSELEKGNYLIKITSDTGVIIKKIILN